VVNPRLLPRRLLTAAALLAVATAARAQQTGSLRVAVFDKDFGSAVADAAIEVVENGRRGATDVRGTVLLADLPAGRYTIVVAKPGFVRAVRGDVAIDAGRVAELRIELAAEIAELEEFVVEESLTPELSTESALLDLRLESPALVDSIGKDLMSKAGASDALQGLRLVAGASSADGKSAVIRGLPDRYVSNQLNGVLLPSADKDKRAVALDQFPSEVIESLRVSKTFTPDQQGSASGGAVDVRLRGVPEEPFFLKWKAGTSYNAQFTARERFLSYDDGGVSLFGKSGRERGVQELGEDWTGAVGAEEIPAPLEHGFSLATGGSFDIGNGWRAGGLISLSHDRDVSSFENGRDDSLWALRAGEPLSPQFSQGFPQSGDFFTSLLDVRRSTQAMQWGGLAILGVADKDHAISLALLRSNAAEDTATIAEDTRGKQYYFPGHDPDNPLSPGYDAFGAAPYLRLQTLEYTERSTESLQLSGRHRVALYDSGSRDKAEIDWTLARSSAVRDTPDKRQFGTWWSPIGVYLPLKPAAQFQLGNLQRIFERIEEDSEEARFDVRLPFEFFGRRAWFKTGFFHDRVERTFNQDTFSNFNQPNISYNGRFDELDWSRVWGFESHPITASQQDVDYEGVQQIGATYAMFELPVADSLRLFSGMRLESTDLRIRNSPEEDAFWIPPGQFGIADLRPGDGDVDYNRDDALPAFGLAWDPVDTLTLRASYAKTVARQTFKELTPIFQQDYLGGPIFVGNPELTMSRVRNFDLRADWRPFTGSLLSASWFRKDIRDPIEYIEKRANFTITTADNFPRGTLTGLEFEARQEIGDVWAPGKGLSLGGNVTLLDGSVRLPDSEILLFEQVQGVRPKSTRDMTNTPDWLYNLYGTYEIEATGTSFGVFYTVTGDTLTQGPGPSNDYFIPATYRTRFETLNVTMSQSLGRGVRLTLAARNLTDAVMREVYRSEFLDDDVERRSMTNGVDWSLSIGGEIRF
jgi:outer membrane receptor protein involved in Fe transport